MWYRLIGAYIISRGGKRGIAEGEEAEYCSPNDNDNDGEERVEF